MRASRSPTTCGRGSAAGPGNSAPPRSPYRWAADEWAQSLVAPERFETIAVAAPGADDLVDGSVLLRVLAGGICGSDVPNFRGNRALVATEDGGLAARLPGYPLHEVVGDVVASRDPAVEVGTRVVGWATGLNGLDEYVVTRGDSVQSYDPQWAPTTAVMLQPLACALYAVEQLGDIAGAGVTVLGQGPIGVLFSHVLKQAGAARVTGVDRVDRSAHRATFDIDDVVHATTARWVGTLTDADRPDVVVECIGHQVATLTHAIDAIRFGGRIFYFGVPDDPVYPMPMNTFLRKNLTLILGFTIERRRVLREADAYLTRFPDLTTAYVTDVLPAARAQEAFATAAHPESHRLKVVLDMTTT